MIDSILNSTKKNLMIEESYTHFDHDILTHINTSFVVLNDLGIGPAEGFMIEDATTTWDAFLGNDPLLNSVKTYVFLYVRRLFDPPQYSHHLQAAEKQIEELGIRLNQRREESEWTDPSSTSTTST